MNRFMGLLLCVVTVSAAGCGEDSTFPHPDNYETKESADQTRKRIAFVEERVGSLESCNEMQTQVNESQSADIAGIRTEFDEHRKTTTDAFASIRTSMSVSDVDRAAMKAQLEDHRSEIARMVGGGSAPQQSPLSPSPSDPPRYQSPPPQYQALIPLQRQQQPPQRACWWCARCRCWHYRN